MSLWRASRKDVTGDRGRFIVFEGIDGSGKSTQAALLFRRAKALGIPSILTSEPSDGPEGRILRSLKSRPPVEEEAALFARDRRHHTESVILPALEQGCWVVCDRYLYSSLAYQGSRGLSEKAILELNGEFAFAPDLIFLPEIPVDVAASRIAGRKTVPVSVFEYRESLEKVAAIYGAIDDPLVQRVDGLRSVEEIHDMIISRLKVLPGFEELKRRLD